MNNAKIVINLQDMTTGELVGVGQCVVEYVTNSNNEELINCPPIKELSKVLVDCKKEMYRKTTAGFGPQIKEADTRRDEMFNAIRMELQAKLPFGGQEAEAAKYLLSLMAHIKSIYDYNYSEQTQILNALHADFQTDKGQEMIATTGIGSKVDALKLAQETFWQMLTERKVIEADMKSRMPASKHKPIIIRYMRTTFQLAWSMSDQQPWQDFYYSIQSIVRIEKQAGRGLSKAWHKRRKQERKEKEMQEAEKRKNSETA